MKEILKSQKQDGSGLKPKEIPETVSQFSVRSSNLAITRMYYQLTSVFISAMANNYKN